MTLSLFIFIGVLMGIIAKITSCLDYNRKKTKIDKKPLGVRNWITSIALFPDLFMPIAFLVAWWYIWKCVAQ